MIAINNERLNLFFNCFLQKRILIIADDQHVVRADRELKTPIDNKIHSINPI